MILPWPRRVRSLLFAPAVRPDLVNKLPMAGADAVVIDCEDATPVMAKDSGRVDAAELVTVIGTKVPALIRVNGVDTPWFLDDIAALPGDIAGIVLPKAESVAGVERATELLGGRGLGHIAVVLGVETALGVADSRKVLAHPMVVAAYFGAEDFIADMGGIRTSGNVEVLHARSAVALAGRLAGVPVIDQIVADFHDDDRYKRECHEAKSLGYGGKLCIHPGQVALANTAFTPSGEDVERARRLLAAYDTASSAGVAAIDFEGSMVDEPVAAQARRLLASDPFRNQGA